MRKRIGVVLSGCGFLDGAEIHEATLTLLAIDRRGAQAVALAPRIEQMHVVDHLAKQPVADQHRDVLVESARIARGAVQALDAAGGAHLDALVLPGGFGVAKNLCTFAVDGAAMKVNAELEALLRAMHAARKPLGFICIAPVIAARVFGASHPRLTIGDDADTAAAVEAMGARHVRCPVDDVVVDADLRIVSTPAYMLGPSIAPVYAGVDKLVGAVLEMA